MKTIASVVVLAFGLGLALYGPVPVSAGPGQAARGGEPTAASLWDTLQKQDYAKTWKMWPGKTALYPGTQPHGALLTTYVNDTAYKAIGAKTGTLPDGTIIAKQNYSSDKKYQGLTAMWKVKGYNPAGDDWFWAQYGPDGKVAESGKVAMCMDCHAKNKANDYIMTAQLK